MDVDAPFAPNMKKIASVLTALGLDECKFERTPRRPDPSFWMGLDRIEAQFLLIGQLFI